MFKETRATYGHLHCLGLGGVQEGSLNNYEDMFLEARATYGKLSCLGEQGTRFSTSRRSKVTSLDS